MYDFIFSRIDSYLITKGASPVTVQGSDDVSQWRAEDLLGLDIAEYADAAQLIDLAALGIDSNNVPDTIIISNRTTTLGAKPYYYEGKTLVGQSTVAQGSLIKAGGALLIDSGSTVNLGTLAGSLVSIDAGELQNGLPGISGYGGDLGNVGGGNFGTISNIGGSFGALNGGSAGAGVFVDFVLDDVATPPLDFGPLNSRPLTSLNPNDFGNLVNFTGSQTAATLLQRAGQVTGVLSFFSDPAAEARAFAEAMRTAAGRALVIDSALTAEQQRVMLYANALKFADQTGAQYGVALTEAQRAALKEPMVWHETRIVDGKPVLVPVLYLPPSDELLQGGRGVGLVSADDLLIDVAGRLSNTGALVAGGLASISAGEILNERRANLSTMDRGDLGLGGAYGGAFGRANSGLISAGMLLMTTDRDLINAGGTLASAGSMDLRIGGSLINETMKITRAVDFLDGCMGNACGGARPDWNVAQIVSGLDLTIIAGGDLTNRGGSIGAVTDALLAAGGDVRFETLQDSYLLKDFHQRGFLSGTDIVEYAITTQQAQAQSLLGSMTMLAGYSLGDGGELVKKAGSQADAILNGALVSAYGDLTIGAAGDITMGAVSTSVDNTYKNWGFQGLGWGKVQQNWNEVETVVTQLSGNNVTLTSGGSITGVGTKIAAAEDLLMLADKDIAFQAAQDAHYFTEKGFSIGLSFPGSSAVDAVMKGYEPDSVLAGLASLSPLTNTLAHLANSDNGVGAGLAALYVGVGGLNGLQGGPATVMKNLTQGLTPDALLSGVGITMRAWENEQRWSESQVAQISAGGDAVLKAGLDVVLDQGTQLVVGNNASISAGRDIRLAALRDYVHSSSESMGLSIYPAALKIEGSYGTSEGNSTTYTNARIEAGGTVDLDAGRDVTLAGGVVSGHTVNVDAGRNLTVISLQDTSTYEETNIGASLTLVPGVGIGGSVSYGQASGNYANVTQQSGIVAGDGGYHIDVVGNVDLKAGLINSSAGPDGNELAANSLTWSDMENISEAEASSYGLSLSPGGLPIPMVGQPAQESSGGTALSTLSPGQLTLHNQTQDLAALNTDSSLTNTQVNLYDIAALRKKQQEAAIISQALNLAVGDIAQIAGLEEGSPEKVALHAVAGALTAAVSGGNIGAAALAGAGQELIGTIINQALDANPNLSQEQRDALSQWGAVLVGAALGGQLGAATALDAEHYNRQLHRDEAEMLARLGEGKTEEERARLKAAACYLVQCAAGVPEDDPHYTELLALQQQGGGYAAEQERLKATGLFGYSGFDGTEDLLRSNREIVDRTVGAIDVVAGASGAAGSAAGGVALASAGCAASFGTGCVVSIAGGTYVAVELGGAALAQAQAGTQQLFGDFSSSEGQRVLDSFDPATHQGNQTLIGELSWTATVSAGIAIGGGWVVKQGGKLFGLVDAKDIKLGGATAANRTGRFTQTYTDGTFSVSDWTGYPSSVPLPPQGTVYMLLTGSEYDAARKLANSTNSQLRKEWNVPKGHEIHEIVPVKYGGSPTDPANKIVLPSTLHRSQVTSWWNRLQRDLGG